ncbi:MAG: hypothetical protein AAFV88_07520 [Planctomycetota bacterium]
MNHSPDPSEQVSDPSVTTAALRSIYVFLIVIALSITAGRIAVVASREGDTAFLSANDRSRWCTIAALVETGTYQIDPYLERRGAKQNRRPWYTIDLVRHRGDDGKLHYYSSKPPLLPTLYAGVYWCVRQTLGMNLSDQPLYLGRIILALVNLPTLAVFLCFSIASIDRVTRSEWAKVFLAAAVCFGTMVMPFAISLSNHLPAAASAAVVLAIFVRGFESRRLLQTWLVGGIAAGFLVANELPSLSIVTFWGLALLWFDRRAFTGYSAGVLLVAIAFFVVNWIAHESLRPPYTHRGIGAEIGTSRIVGTLDQDSVRELLSSKGLVEPDDSIEISDARVKGRKRITVNDSQLFALEPEMSKAPTWSLRQWDDWYDYPGSYWVDGRRRGVDLGEPSRVVYLANLTVGHHGLVSLTPLWLLVPFGMTGLWRLGRDPQEGSKKHAVLLATIAAATVVCVAFYVMRPEIDRNYGGVSVCFRWMLWFAPLWLFTMAGPVDWLARRGWSRCLGIVLLAGSAVSMSTALASPWQSPWLYRFWVFLGWLSP